MKFALRDLLWLTVVVALATGWIVDRWRMRKRFDNTIRYIFKNNVRPDGEHWPGY